MSGVMDQHFTHDVPAVAHLNLNTYKLYLISYIHVQNSIYVNCSIIRKNILLWNKKL